MLVTFTDGRQVNAIDRDCEFRPCFQFGFDKGSFTPGVGYTRYHAKERPVCLRNHVHGCPSVASRLVCWGCDTELMRVRDDEVRPLAPEVCPSCGARGNLHWHGDVLPDPQPCCAHPRVPKPSRRQGRLPLVQTCLGCGTRLSGRRLESARRG